MLPQVKKIKLLNYLKKEDIDLFDALNLISSAWKKSIGKVIKEKEKAVLTTYEKRGGHVYKS
jgi:hypothetical protein